MIHCFHFLFNSLEDFRSVVHHEPQLLGVPDWHHKHWIRNVGSNQFREVPGKKHLTKVSLPRRKDDVLESGTTCEGVVPAANAETEGLRVHHGLGHCRLTEHHRPEAHRRFLQATIGGHTAGSNTNQAFASWYHSLQNFIGFLVF